MQVEMGNWEVEAEANEFILVLPSDEMGHRSS